MIREVLLILGGACLAAGAGAPDWTLAKTGHFEVYAQSSTADARALTVWMEQMRSFCVRAGLAQPAAPVRVIAFHSPGEYGAYRLHAGAAAYYVGLGDRSYIVLPSPLPSSFPLAAHEYAHAVLHAGGLNFPVWLQEGLSEVFAGHARPLPRERWIPLRQILDATVAGDDRFYAESRALADLLVFSPDYRPRLGRFLAALNAGRPSAAALTETFGRSLDAIERDMAGPRSRSFSLAAIAPPAMEVASASNFASRLMLADLTAAIGETDRAIGAYRELERDSPRNPEIPAALGWIAMRRGDHSTARTEWKKAFDLGIPDPEMCFQFASLQTSDARRALERAIELRPGFDDAHYSLALLLKNAGDPEAALTHFRAIHNIAPQRAYHYWSAIADALLQLDRRDEARNAARKAAEVASDAEERAHASELSYLAATDGVARMDGGRMVTTRVPHGSSDWNPFVEPGDHIVRTEGQLVEVTCEEGTRFIVKFANETIALMVPDLSRVLVRNSAGEITCGAQSATVVVEYAAATHILRGVEFR